MLEVLHSIGPQLRLVIIFLQESLDTDDAMFACSGIAAQASQGKHRASIYCCTILYYFHKPVSEEGQHLLDIVTIFGNFLPKHVLKFQQEKVKWSSFV